MRATGPPGEHGGGRTTRPGGRTREIRIAVKAAGINFAELLARSGVYPDAPKPPCVLGYEVAGEVESLGEGVEDFAIGDPVFAPTLFGGQAELVTVPAENAWAKPDRLSFEQAAALPVNYTTALAALIEMGGLHEGQRILIHAAAGGVGTAAIQIAKEIGAEIFGTASAGQTRHSPGDGGRPPDRLPERRLRGSGQRDHFGRRREPDHRRDRARPTSRRTTGSSGREESWSCSACPRSRVPRVSSTAERSARWSACRSPRHPWWKSLAVMTENKGVFGLNLLDWWKDEGMGRLGKMLGDRLDAGQFDPVIAEVFTFEEAPEAHRFIESRQNIGKVLLIP